MRSAQVANKDATPTGSAYKSRDDIVVCVVDRCCVVCDSVCRVQMKCVV